MKILFIGDIMGKSGRRVLRECLSEVINSNQIDFVIANGENVAGGKGITSETGNELFSYGVNVITSGNHIFDKRDSFNYIDQERSIIRPANYPDVSEIRGAGWGIFETGNNIKIGVTNLCGRTFMPPMDCPFLKAKKIIEELKKETNIIFIDFHAEATSEKIAFKWYLDGEVSAIVGTHTHVQTADECITQKGTAYITDAGMTGAYDSVIGVKKEPIINSFVTGLPAQHVIANDDLKFNGVVIDIDSQSGKAQSIKRLFFGLKDNKQLN